MALEVLRIKHLNRNSGFIEDDELGILRFHDTNLSPINFIEHKKYHLLDVDNKGKFCALNLKDWLAIKNTTRTELLIINNESGNIAFSTRQFLTYRASFDCTGNKCLVEYYGGLACIDLVVSKIVFQQKIDLTIYNGALLNSNEFLIPISNRKAIGVFDFDKLNYHIEKIDTSTTSWIKAIPDTSHFLVSDNKNNLHRFNRSNLNKPIWTIDFNKYAEDGRIWCWEPFVTGNIGCVQGFSPQETQTAIDGGKLWVFNLESGLVINDIDYTNIKQRIASGFLNSSILLFDLSEFNLVTEKQIDTVLKTKVKAGNKGFSAMP